MLKLLDLERDIFNQVKDKIYNSNHYAQSTYPDRNDRVGSTEFMDLLEKQKFQCARCNSSFKDTMLTIDHIIPYDSGGRHNIQNIQLLCFSCNSVKGIRYINYLCWDKQTIETAEKEKAYKEVSMETRKKLSLAAINRLDKKPRYNNPSGTNGICFIKKKNRWHVQLSVFTQTYSLGLFKTLKEAKEAKLSHIKVALWGNVSEAECSLISRKLRFIGRKKGKPLLVLNPYLNNKKKIDDWKSNRLEVFCDCADLFLIMNEDDSDEVKSKNLKKIPIVNTLNDIEGLL